MLGLEAVGIVYAFTGATKLLIEWKTKRRERNKKTQNVELQASLTLGGAQVQNEYDQDFARLGRLFAVGDGRSEQDGPELHC
jgi:hypothetical protein